ncbi:MAG: hypothetical protein CVU56_28580 [Deltaproteobacteria bacterium HGW-Deltaproteobacteria-14]|jgi:negative regulator of flagellin synthesis FlgM|nr:MAG: hypothetical protein CVU56_28580 [Deltaproteobacteria bacterium HGW-Deltaproteobacteria-14]
MDPTRPISSKPIPEPGARNVGRVPKVPHATSQTGGGPAAAEVAASVAGAHKALEAGHAAASKEDSVTLSELREAFENGTYTVDADALADRILDDALGDEWLG